MFLEEDSQTTWNDSFIYYGMFLEKDSETTWNNSYI